MAKKIEEAEVKKECPSCGLGVALDSKICEFCGWDFEEEDEWILQIEKLERELMLEKQKFEPGSVDHKIEATLYTPTPGRPQPTREASEDSAPTPKVPTVERQVRHVAAPPGPKPSAPVPVAAKPRAEEPAVVTETIDIENARIRSVRGAPEPAPGPAEAPVRKVRTVKTAEAPPASEAAPETTLESKTKKVRVVRKIKK